MSVTRTIDRILRGAAILAVAACGPRGLPPGDPKPGEVDVGYGTQPEAKATGAVTSVSGTEVSGNPSASIEELLRGRVAGLQIVPRPEGGYRFLIRGLNTGASEPTEPLFVIDGVQTGAHEVGAALAGLTRKDIRQVDVLKDVASTAIYGGRGVGGVIVITTTRR